MKKLFTPLSRPTMTRFPSKKRGQEACLLIAQIHRMDSLIYQNYRTFAKQQFLNTWKIKKN